MTGRGFLLVAAFLAAGLAGCASTPPGPAVQDPGLVAVSATELVPGGYYAFDHPGGELAFSTRGNSSADIVLYGADDRRIGRIGVGDQDAAGRFILDDVAAGEVVVQVLALDGDEDGLDIRSAGTRVRAFERLPVHVERHQLVNEEYTATSLGGLLPFGGGPVDANKDIELRRAPSALRLMYLGSFSDLSVIVSGSSGPVLQSENGGSVPATGPYSLDQLPAQTFTENIRDGRLSAQVSAAEFQGVLFLEAWTFSRARPVAASAQLTDDTPRFTYGVLPDQPVSFQVREGTEWLYLFYEGSESEGLCRESVQASGADPDGSCSEAALVALFDPTDRRVATVSVRFNETMAIPVDAVGEWVAVLLDGEATLGASRVPADFELHPLDVRTTQVPTAAAGSGNGRYGQGTTEVSGQGVIFRITGMSRSPELSGFSAPTPLDYRCGPPSLVAYQAGETVGAWGFTEDETAPGQGGLDDPAGPLDPNALLDGSALTLVHDDFGSECDRMTLQVDAYTR